MERLARAAAGWEDILAAPEGVKAEVIAGELFLQPRPRPAHGHTQASLTAEVFPAYYHGRGGPGGWWILIEPDVDFGPYDIVSPDLVGFRRERVPDFPAERPIRAVPDWVCEVLSPSTARLDRIEKADLYLRVRGPPPLLRRSRASHPGGLRGAGRCLGAAGRLDRRRPAARAAV